MGCCTSQPEGPVQLTLQASKAAAATAGGVRDAGGGTDYVAEGVVTVADAADSDTVGSGVRREAQSGARGNESETAEAAVASSNTPYLLLHRNTASQPSSDGNSKNGRGQALSFSSTTSTTGSISSTSTSGSLQFPGSVAADTSTSAANNANSEAGAIPVEPRSRGVLASPATHQDSPAARRLSPAEPPHTRQHPQRLDLRQSLAARMISSSMAVSEHQAANFIMLQYRELQPEDFELLCNLDEAVPRRGTAPRSLLQSFRRVPSQECGSDECRVCLRSLAGETQVLMLPCGHAFHEQCITKWACEYRGDCPLCGQSLISDKK
eukprot:TRINITY_DN106231_c0_g1_i1.p1 TRINITY_DN106231_c0_g1~~TRINITY_DN106231_c0_g1_i1.p1  ORF type:complete len:323 (-),score=55.84 TRINITY_DN106231_c0_g1_i1:125-1093(-)